MPRYGEGVWESIHAELWYKPERRALLLKALEGAGEPARTLSWGDFKQVMVACIGRMYGPNRVSDPGRYTLQALEDNSANWQKLHAELHQELGRQADAAAKEKERLDNLKREPAGGILADASEASASLAHQLLGLGPNNARQAVRLASFSGDVSPTFLKGRRTYHTTCDDLDGQGAKDVKHSGKKKITFFYDFCDRDCKPGYYLVGWGVHISNIQYQLEGMVPPTGHPLDKDRQWDEGLTLTCGTQKEKKAEKKK